MNFAATLDDLLAGAHMNEQAAQQFMDATLSGDMPPERLAAVLIAIRAKGIHADELVGMARSMRAHGHRITAPGPLLDNCGTGGAAVKTFNVSTAASFVIAADDIRVAKHGNRSVTRPSGSADILEGAGARLDLTPAQCTTVLERAGIAFLFAPTFHPAMRHAGPVRQQLGIKTIFNLLGPLTNPAGAQQQVLGVYDAGLVTPMAEALARLGCQSGIVLYGQPGTDEATPCGTLHMQRVTDGTVGAAQELVPAAVGIDSATPAAVAPVPKDQAAGLLKDILSGKETSPRSETVAFNAGIAIHVAGHAPDVRSGIDRARALLSDGSGMAKWDAFIAANRSCDE